MDFGERLSTAGIVTLEGMAVIFLVLALLWGIIEVLHRVVSKAQKTAEAVEQNAPTATEAPEGEASSAEDGNGAVIAAIVAAISAMRAEEGNTGAFRVVAFHRASQNGRRNRI